MQLKPSDMSGDQPGKDLVFWSRMLLLLILIFTGSSVFAFSSNVQLSPLATLTEAEATVSSVENPFSQFNQHRRKKNRLPGQFDRYSTNASDALNGAIASSHWKSDSTLSESGGSVVFEKVAVTAQAISQLQSLISRNSANPELSTQLESIVNSLVENMFLLAQSRVQTAVHADGVQRKIERSVRMIRAGDKHRSRGKYNAAIKQYGKAWRNLSGAYAENPVYASISGQVFDASGRWVQGIVVSALNSNDGSVTIDATTDKKGRYELRFMPDSAVTLKYTSVGYSDQVYAIGNIVAGDKITQNVVITRRAAVQSFDEDNGASVTSIDGASVTIAANSFSSAAGTGDIAVSVTPIDPSNDSASFPGDTAGTSLFGPVVTIVPVGVVEFEFTDALGNELDLVANTTANVDIPLYQTVYSGRTTPLEAGDTIPVWSLNEETGIWLQEAIGNIVANDQSPTGLSVSAEVSHFSFYAAADSDGDGDGVLDSSDVFPLDASESVDTDGDGVGDNADAFPADAAESVDTDGDAVGDNADAFPADPAETADTDSDGVGDNADAFPADATDTADSDGDGVGDNADVFPNDATESADSDGDGIGDNADSSSGCFIRDTLVDTALTQSECDALVAIYDGTDGPNWRGGRGPQWLELIDPCEWRRVTCEGGVTELNLGSLLINGPIPAEIGNLVNLTRLGLSLNSITSVPAEIGNLTSLQNLSISRNELTAIPAEIGALTNLQGLFLDSNELTAIPAEIGALTQLTDLTLRDNQLATIPAELGNLTLLPRLDLSRNQLTEVPVELANLVNLQDLSLASNQLTSLPAELGGLVDLVSLSASDNQLSAMPVELSNLVNLQILLLSINQLTLVPVELGNLQNLRELNLLGNQIASTGSIPVELGSLPLTSLDLASNAMTGTLAELLAKIDLTLMESLSLSDNELSGPIPSELGLAENLGNLTLYNNQLSGEIPSEFWMLADTLPASTNQRTLSGNGCLTASDANLILYLDRTAPNWAEGCLPN